MLNSSSDPYSFPALTDLCAILSDMLPDLPGILYRCRNTRSWTMLDLAEPVRDLTGYGPEELIEDAEIAYAELIHEEDRDRVWEEVQEALGQGLSFRTSYRIRTRDGDVRQVWEQGRRAADDGDEILGFIQDVTDWKAKWEQLEQSAQLLEKTLASLEEAVLVIDTSGEGRGILNVNQATERMFGWSADELIGGTTEKLHVSRESFEAFARELDPILQQEGVVHASYPMQRKDGSEFAAEQTVTLLDSDEGIAGGAVSVIRDVSEQHTLRRQLQQSQRLEAIGRLAGGVAHDFNNLLTVIRAHSDFLVMELGAEALTEEVRAIQNAARHAADLTRQLLAFSREQVLRPRVVDLNEVVRRVERLLERVLGEPIELRTALHPDPLPLEVDPGQLEQAVMNLAVNARDAMPDGGILTLGTGPEERDEETDGFEVGSGAGPPSAAGWVRLTVSDTGVGMDAETQSRIFEPFYTTKEQGRGTGLGLATAYGFVNQSGGTIEVESEPGEGSRFILRFPAAAEELTATDEEREAPPAATLEGCTALVVEDEAGVRAVIEKALVRAGCSVHTADAGEEGLEILERCADEIAVVLTDLVLPGIGGAEVARRVLDRHRKIPVIVMSGYAPEEPGRSGEIPAEAGFIAKPFTPAALVDRIRKAVAER